METGFEKLNRLIQEKNSRIVLGLDPTDEMNAEIIRYGSLKKYLKWLIDQTNEYIVGIKPNLAFYEHSADARKTMRELMIYADKKYGLVKILDVKRGDILDTQARWAKADITNFNPDIVTLNPYMGGADVVMPYLNQNEKICTYVLTATSNPGAREFQDLLANGLTNYQSVVLLAHEWNKDRVGFVVGSTKTDAVKNIRMTEKEYGYEPAPILAPGFGKQGGSLDFVKYAGRNTVYPLSSGLTKDKYLNGKTPKEAAKLWRDEINNQLKHEIEIPSLTEHVVNNLISEDLIFLPKTPQIERWPLLKKGRNKLETANVKLTGIEEEKFKILKKALDSGILNKDDFGSIFLQIRDIIGTTETRRLMAHLYTKMIKDSGIKYDKIGSIAYGAINTGDLVSYILDKPAFLLRKERGTETTHSDIVGKLNRGETAIMIEDVTTSADSLISDIKMLREKIGVNITDAFVFVKRTPEGEIACKQNQINLHYIMDMNHLKHLINKNPNIRPDVKTLILN